ncbi:thioesterase [Natronosporangium hydrolyticum]|uniref:Thioesterase n=1 Tax=Natronosporangium hydrolyticum TaxID=2811111 RepID=A0A895YIP0_9ACTN|nr:alpha/beta fold hydrolase [Natronosporangium hydrolyticum]QSB13990.1 thioesterase [Natronosporangium hydrolyticum]
MSDLLLFCLPYAGGSAPRVYGEWAHRVPEPIQVVPLELPGRGARIAEPLLTRVNALTDDALGAVLPRVDRPFALFGHSLGALIAFELARRLEHLHRRVPAHVIVSGHGAPQLPPSPETDYQLPMPEFKRRLRDLAGTPEEILANEELLELFAPIIRADFEAADTYRYRPTPRLSCPLTVYGGLTDPEAEVSTLSPWQEQTSAHCAVRVLPGGHFFLHHETDALLAGVVDDLLAALASDVH